MKPEIEKILIKDYQTHTYQKLAEKYKISIPTIKKILLKNNVKKLKNSRVNMSKVGLNINYFSNIDTPNKAYWLGYICGDGSIYKNIKTSITSKDYLIIKCFKNDIKSGHKISKVTTHDKRTNKNYVRYMIQITNEIFTNHIIKQGVTNNKSYELNFPNIDEKYYPYFIVGLFDSDGSLHLKNNKMRCDLITTREIIDFIKKYLKNNFNIKTNSDFLVSDNGMNVYRVYWYSDSMRFLNFIYGDNNFNYLKRKYDTYLKALSLGIKSRFKKVQQFDLNLNLINVWDNAKEASIHINTPYSTLREKVNGEMVHKNYIWKYEKQ